MSPFGPYKNFEQCVSENQDKDNPEGYCSATHKKITGEWPGVKKMDDDKEFIQNWIPVPTHGSKGHYTDEPCPGSKIRSEGRGRGLGIGGGKGPIGRMKPGTIKKSLAFVMKAPKSHPEFWSPNHLHTAKTGFPECHRCKKPIEAGSKYYRWQWPDSSVVRVHEQHRTEE